MSTQQDPHEAEVRRIATILNKCEGDYTGVHSPMTLGKARAMVAEMRNIAEEAYKEALHDADVMHPTFSVSFNKFQKKRGLIASPTKTGE